VIGERGRVGEVAKVVDGGREVKLLRELELWTVEVVVPREERGTFSCCRESRRRGLRG
jgi:uridine phosphorylase